MEFRRVPQEIAFPPTPEQFGNQLIAMVDPRTPEEIVAFNDSAARVAENARVLRQALPSSTGEVDGLRMSDATGPVELTPGQEVSLGDGELPKEYVHHDISSLEDSQSPEQRAVIRASRDRVRATEKALRARLRPARDLTGRFTW